MAPRRQRGSRRWKKAQARAARIKARGARIRKHVNHDLTTDIARRYGGVVLEDLKIKNMTKSAKGTKEDPGNHVRQKAGLHRSIAEQSCISSKPFLATSSPNAVGIWSRSTPHTRRKTAPHAASPTKTAAQAKRCIGVAMVEPSIMPT
jgi:hypothetical protein